MTLSHTAQLAQEHLHYILLLYGKNASGGPGYAYLSVRMDEMDDFLRAQAEPECLALEAYGRVLAAGNGEPDEAVRQEMEAVYGFNHAQCIVLRERDKQF